LLQHTKNNRFQNKQLQIYLALFDNEVLKKAVLKKIKVSVSYSFNR
jgi:hypothetical protein